MANTVKDINEAVVLQHAHGGSFKGLLRDRAVGAAAIVPVTLGMALAAMQKDYALGSGILCHYGNDDQQRSALILRYQ
jgi:hypothetical protein